MISTHYLYERALIDNIINETDFSDSLFEVATNAPQSLIDLQETLKPICKTPSQFNKNNTRKIAKRVAKKIQDFTGIKNIKVEFYKDYMNFAVVPIYDFEEDTPSKRFDFMKEDVKIKNIKDVEELDPSITGMHLFIGLKFIKELKLTSNEFIAVLLHEIGHVFYHKTITPRIVQSLMRLAIAGGQKLTTAAVLARFIYIKLNNSIVSDAMNIRGILITIMATLYLSSRSISFFEHREEYGCDEVAARFGYGQEMSSVLVKIGKYEGNIGKSGELSLFKKAIAFIQRIFSSNEHPVTTDRVCKLSKKMLDDYAKTYPIAQDAIQKQYKKLRC